MHVMASIMLFLFLLVPVVLPFCSHGSVEFCDICNTLQDNGHLPDINSLESQRHHIEKRLSAAVEAADYTAAAGLKKSLNAVVEDR